MNTDHIISELEYTSYATNRDLGITKAGWILMGMPEETAERMEERYLLEQFKESIRQAYGHKQHVH